MRHPITLFALLVAAAAVGVCAAAGASAPPTIAVVINGELQEYVVPPMVANGRILVPMRGIFESLGAEVRWDGAKRAVTATAIGTEVRLSVGSRDAVVNGERLPLEAAPSVVRGTVFVPLRFVSEALGAEVKWDPAKRRVLIGWGEQGEAPPTPPPAAAMPAPAAGTAQTVRVGLQEYIIDLTPRTVKAGAITFVVLNKGIASHALAIDGTEARTRLLGRGNQVALTVTLQPGVYTLYSPAGHDRATGMETKLKVE